MRVSLYIAITILLWLAAAPAAVQAEMGGSDDHTEEARERFRRGVTLYREGALRAALIEFQRAYELKPHFALLSNIGQTQLELGDYLAASNALCGYLDEGGSEVPPERREKVEKQLASLQERIAVLTISVNLPEAEIFVDGETVGNSPRVQGLSVNVGRHVVRVRSRAGSEESKVVDLAGGDVRELHFELEPSVQQGSVATATSSAFNAGPVQSAEPAEKASRKRYHKLAFVSLIGAGALAAGTVAGIVLQQRATRSYDDALRTPDVDPNVVAVHQTNAWRRAVAVDVLAGLTVVAAGTGVTFWLLGKRSRPDERSGLRVGVSGTQLHLKGKF